MGEFRDDLLWMDHTVQRFRSLVGKWGWRIVYWGPRRLGWLPGILRLTYFVIRRVEGVRRNHEGCLVENVMMSSTFWYIDKLDIEVKKVRERFDSGSCATKCICISSSYFELSEACVMRSHEGSWIA